MTLTVLNGVLKHHENVAVNHTVSALQQVLVHTGATWVMWLLGLLSLLSIGVMCERWFFFRRLGCNIAALAQQLDAKLQEQDFKTATRDFAKLPAIAAQIAAAGLKLAHLGPAAADKAMHSAVALQRVRLERGLVYLGTLGNNAPFIGLFGTVVGVIGAFEELGHSTPGHAGISGSAQVASQAVMTSIAEALVATAVGLMVALPAVAAYNYFQRRIAALLGETEVLSNLLLAYLSTTPAARNSLNDDEIGQAAPMPPMI